MDQNQIAVYVRPGERPDRKSLHLAVWEKGKWQALNFGMGVLFPEADYDGEIPAGLTKVLKEPRLFRRKDGSIGVAAKVQRIRRVGNRIWEPWEEDPSWEEMYWTTKNLAEYRELSKEEYDEAKRELLSAIEPLEKSILEIDGEWVEAQLFSLKEEERIYIGRKLLGVENVSVDPIEVEVFKGERPALPGLTAHYSDGSVQEIPVEWNAEELAEIAEKSEGEYILRGSAMVEDFPEPIVEGVADPDVFLYMGRYYLIGTNEFRGGKDLYIRRSESLTGLSTAEPVKIFAATESGDHCGCNWAPELHVIGGRLCCLFASSTNGNWDHVQSRVMFCDGDPLNPADWSEPLRVQKRDGSALIEKGITLDMTYFEAAGKSYYCWAQRDIDERGTDSSDLWIAEMDPVDPVHLATDPVRILRPLYAWDREDTEVDEGPHVLKHDGMLYLAFSADAVGDDYCMGWLVAKEGEDLLKPESWREIGYPVLARDHAPALRGPGHNSFVKDEFGRDVLIYHAKLHGGMRSFFARRIHFGFDGGPLLYLTKDRELKPEYRQVTALVKVTDREKRG